MRHVSTETLLFREKHKHESRAALAYIASISPYENGPASRWRQSTKALIEDGRRVLRRGWCTRDPIRVFPEGRQAS